MKTCEYCGTTNKSVKDTPHYLLEFGSDKLILCCYWWLCGEHQEVFK